MELSVGGFGSAFEVVPANHFSFFILLKRKLIEITDNVANKKEKFKTREIYILFQILFLQTIFKTLYDSKYTNRFWNPSLEIHNIFKNYCLFQHRSSIPTSLHVIIHYDFLAYVLNCVSRAYKVFKAIRTPTGETFHCCDHLQEVRL